MAKKYLSDKNAKTLVSNVKQIVTNAENNAKVYTDETLNTTLENYLDTNDLTIYHSIAEVGITTPCTLYALTSAMAENSILYASSISNSIITDIPTYGALYIDYLGNSPVIEINSHDHRIVGYYVGQGTFKWREYAEISTLENGTITVGNAAKLEGSTKDEILTEASNNSGVKTITSGTANGTINVNTNGTSVDVAITGLGAAAYKAVADSTSASAIGASSNLVTERDVYYGLPIINGTHTYTSSNTIYAPTTGGTSGYVLKANGSTSAPTWSKLADLDALVCKKTLVLPSTTESGTIFTCSTEPRKAQNWYLIGIQNPQFSVGMVVWWHKGVLYLPDFSQSGATFSSKDFGDGNATTRLVLTASMTSGTYSVVLSHGISATTNTTCKVWDFCGTI